MKKLILSSLLIALMTGCQPGNKSGSASTNKNSGQQQGTNANQSTDGTTTAEDNGDGVVDSVSRQEALADLDTKVFKAATRLQMDLIIADDTTEEKPADDSKLNDDQKAALKAQAEAKKKRQEENAVLKAWFFQKGGPAKKTVLSSLNDGDIKVQVDLKDLQGELTDDSMQLQAILVAFKKITAAYGLNDAQQSQIVEILKARAALIDPNDSQTSTIVGASENIKKKSITLIQNFHDGDDAKLCGATAIFVNNLETFLKEKQLFMLPALIQKQVELTKPYADLLKNCNADIPAARKTLGTLLPGTIDGLDNVLGLLKLFVNPMTKDTSPAGLEVMDRYLLAETKEVLEAQGLPMTGDIAVDGVVCQIDRKIYGSKIEKYNDEVTTGKVDYDANGETALTIRKMANQRGVTITYTSSKVAVLDASNTTAVNMGEGFVSTVFNMVPGNKEPMTVILVKDPKTNEPLFVSCHSK